MTSAFVSWIVFAAATLLELGTLKREPLKMWKITFGGLVIVMLAASQASLLVSEPLLFSIPFFIVGLYRIMNMMRFVQGRMHQGYLYHVVIRTSLQLLAVQAALEVLRLLAPQLHVGRAVLVSLFAAAQLVAAAIVGYSLRVGISKSTMAVTDIPAFADSSLPSLTVAIPARNETDDLEQCLRSFTASTYLKLEILVLDDCSQDRTPEIIKEFAHDGVRFISGTEPGDTWLPKNAAYAKLASEASSDLLLFCGVDVRVDPDTLRNMVAYFEAQHLSMMSILPERATTAKAAGITQQIRYLWELALPRFISNRPPVLSTMWLTDARMLKKMGGLGAVRRTVVPEGFFARELARKNQYQFLRSNPLIRVQSAKTTQAQHATALRVRYPQLHRRPEVVLLLSALELLLVAGTFPLLVYALHAGYSVAAVLAALALASYIVALGMFSVVLGNRDTVRYFMQGFVTILADVWLMHQSMFLYEFDEVRWKQRNICLPVMHVVQHLPLH